jgi:microcystin-dependent protein
MKEGSPVSQPFVGQLLLVPYNFAPADWDLCQGQLISIAENATLFNLIGTTYGGDGQATYSLPDLRGRIPLHQGSNGVSTYVIGQVGGVENVTVTVNQYPQHAHAFQASNSSTGLTSSPTNMTVGAGVQLYSTEAPNAAMNSAMVSQYAGGGQPHNNLQPFLVLNWIISLFGVYPSQN